MSDERDKWDCEKEYHELRIMYDRLFDQGSEAIDQNVALRAELSETQKAMHELGVEHLALKAELAKYTDNLTEDELFDVGMLIPNDIRKIDFRIREVRGKRNAEA